MNVPEHAPSFFSAPTTTTACIRNSSRILWDLATKPNTKDQVEKKHIFAKSKLRITLSKISKFWLSKSFFSVETGWN